MSSVRHHVSRHSPVRAGIVAIVHRFQKGSSALSRSRGCSSYVGIRSYPWRRPFSTRNPDGLETGCEAPDDNDKQAPPGDPIDSDVWWSELRSKRPLSQFISVAQSSSPGKVREVSEISHIKEDGSPLPNKPVSPQIKSRAQYQAHKKSRRERKGEKSERVSQVPTKKLIYALKSSGRELDETSRPKWVIDLSWVSPDLLMDRIRRRQKTDLRRSVIETSSRRSLQAILADYLICVDSYQPQPASLSNDKSVHDCPKVDTALKTVFDESNLKYIAARGYSEGDVMSWAWILKSRSSYQATLRLLMLKRQVPPFVPLFLLRHEHLGIKTFRLLLLYSLYLITGKSPPVVDSMIKYPSEGMEPGVSKIAERLESQMDPTMAMTFVVRLLRHARRVWPQSQLSIARTFASFLTHIRIKAHAGTMNAVRLNRFRAQKFNACLRLLALPTKHGPFISVSIQQQAQFELLKAMAAHQPVLPVSRQGYQAIIAVQLAHKKTQAERQSAEYKAASWPPWKEEKLGIDVQRGNEGMKSRAMQVMMQMVEAGYSHTLWEEIATILAGWDTDHSPTIQTRALMRRPLTLPEPAKSNPNDPAAWKARIRATRTVREAWACFLAYQDLGLPARIGIYYAMAEKLVFRRNAIENNFDRVSLALPGDAPEAFPEPPSARDLIYVRTEPPTLDGLLKQMLRQDIRPSGRFLAMLLRFSSTFSSGLDYLSCSGLSNKQVKTLCTVWSRRSDPEAIDGINSTPDYLFFAFIEFLCRFSAFDPIYAAGHHLRIVDLFPIVMHDSGVPPPRMPSSTTLFSYDHVLGEGDESHHPKTLAHAVRLMKVRMPRYPPPWIALLSALAADRLTISGRKVRRSIQRILAWYEVVEVTRWMTEIDVEPGTAGFHILCTSFVKAVNAGTHDPVAAAEGHRIVAITWQRADMPPQFVCRTLEEMVREGLSFLKRRFDTLVLPGSGAEVQSAMEDDGSDTTEPSMPSMLQIPSPAVLHSYVRALGVAKDYDGLLNLLRWMSRSASTLQEMADDLMNGERMMRRTLVAARVFLEGAWKTGFQSPGSGSPSKLIEDESRQAGITRMTPSIGGKQASVLPNPHLQEAYNIIETTAIWGSWPSDEEVRNYILWNPSMPK